MNGSVLEGMFFDEFSRFDNFNKALLSAIGSPNQFGATGTQDVKPQYCVAFVKDELPGLVDQAPLNFFKIFRRLAFQIAKIGGGPIRAKFTVAESKRRGITHVHPR